MDSEPHSDTQPTFESSIKDADSAPNAGAFFPRAQNFVVAGGVFKSKVTNNIHQPVPSSPSDFRRIPLGDIDLHHEILLDYESGVVDRSRGRACFRRMYSAKIDGRKSKMTVAVYQGDNAEEEWREAISKYSWLRHPNFVQLYGVTSTPGLYAAIIHDDLIPYDEFLDLYRHSPILTVYIWASCQNEFRDAYYHCWLVCQIPLRPIDCTFWIRRSTGRLCADLMPSGLIAHVPFDVPTSAWRLRSHNIISLEGPVQDALAISSLTLQQYHEISWRYLGQRHRISTPTQVTVNLGTIIWCSLDYQFEDSVEIACLPDLEFWDSGWENSGELVQKDMGNGWTRYNSCDVCDIGFRFGKQIWLSPSKSDKAWLSQANHIFDRLQITSNYENYMLIEHIGLHLTISAARPTLPDGYLFLCPPEDFQIGPCSFRRPDCPAYWSLDPSGVEHLSRDEATRLGFPFMDFDINGYGKSWDASVYTGLREFHQAKGFNPDSQEIARHLGYPLYQLSNVVEGSFAHGEL
ncbi:hypothetical protein C8R44DRAFT_711334 [Mycena epipterygia]|nr:hypothetical protein C8R44DRAFT_711334 [Mycena epipterygia]